MKEDVSVDLTPAKPPLPAPHPAPDWMKKFQLHKNPQGQAQHSPQQLMTAPTSTIAAAAESGKLKSPSQQQSWTFALDSAPVSTGKIEQSEPQSEQYRRNDQPRIPILNNPLGGHSQKANTISALRSRTANSIPTTTGTAVNQTNTLQSHGRGVAVLMTGSSKNASHLDENRILDPRLRAQLGIHPEINRRMLHVGKGPAMNGNTVARATTVTVARQDQGRRTGESHESGSHHQRARSQGYGDDAHERGQSLTSSQSVARGDTVGGRNLNLFASTVPLEVPSINSSKRLQAMLLTRPSFDSNEVMHRKIAEGDPEIKRIQNKITTQALNVHRNKSEYEDLIPLDPADESLTDQCPPKGRSIPRAKKALSQSWLAARDLKPPLEELKSPNLQVDTISLPYPQLNYDPSGQPPKGEEKTAMEDRDNPSPALTRAVDEKEDVDMTPAGPDQSTSTEKPKKYVGQYKLSKTIGKGSMGKVKLAVNQVTGEWRACKIIQRNVFEGLSGSTISSFGPTASVWDLSVPPDHVFNNNNSDSVIKEKRILREAAIALLLHHPHICTLYEVAIISSYYYFFFEFVNGGQMLDYIISHGKLKEKSARRFIRQIVSAVDYCHLHNVVHRDLKIENVLIDTSGNVKLIDFGLSNMYSPKSHLKTSCGSLYFAAPELLNAKEYIGPEVDVWSMGIILYVLVCGKVPFDDTDMSALYRKIKSGYVEYPPHVSSECQHLIGRMLDVNPHTRATMPEIKAHIWITKGFPPPFENFVPKRTIPFLPLRRDVIAKMKWFEARFEDIELRLHKYFQTRHGHQVEDNEICDEPLVSVYFLTLDKIERDSVAEVTGRLNTVKFEGTGTTSTLTANNHRHTIIPQRIQSRPTYQYHETERQNPLDSRVLSKPRALSISSSLLPSLGMELPAYQPSRHGRHDFVQSRSAPGQDARMLALAGQLTDSHHSNGSESQQSKPDNESVPETYASEACCSEVPNPPAGRVDQQIRSVYLKGLFAVGNTSAREPSCIRDELNRVFQQNGIRVLEALGVFRCEYVPSILSMSSLRRGWDTADGTSKQPLAPPPEVTLVVNSDQGSDPSSRDEVGKLDLASFSPSNVPTVRFDVSIVKIPWLGGLHGVRFQRISGDGWQYKQIVTLILDAAKLKGTGRLECSKESNSNLSLRTLALSAAIAAVVGGTAYLVYSNVSSSSSKKSKLKGTKPAQKAIKGKNQASVSKKAAVAAESDHSTHTVEKAPEADPGATQTAATEDNEAEILSIESDSLTQEVRAELAKTAKTVGNRLFGEKKYEEAIQYYSKAIELQPDAIYFANRAACFANLSMHERVIEDCTAALELDSRYIKALYRRAQAYTSVNKLDESLRDYTAICMLEEFKKESSIAATDRILKDIGKDKTTAVMATKTPRLPSETFIKAYMDSFRPKLFGAEVVLAMESVEAGDDKLKEACRLILERQWNEAMDTIAKALTMKLSPKFESIAHNLNGTFCFLRGQVDESFQAFDKALELDSTNVNSLIKRASIFMEKGDLESALREYARAEDTKSEDPDLYYHRGQVRFLTSDLEAAISDYRKSLDIDDSFVYAHIQLGVALYKSGNKSEAANIFKAAAKKFKDSPEVFNYHGELLLDQGSYELALENFDKAIQINPSSPLPYINKSILYLQWKGDAASSESFCRKAIEVDSLCDIAFIQLAQLLIQQNRLQDALDTYDEAISVIRTEPELMNAISCREACAAQLYVSQLYPDVYSKLRGMGGFSA
ncbi:serine/threonine-protein kinase KIN2 [Blyttiomyces sp. JEL0837]|nr:serine/threonine-protein kinase KIN2 [Blyttiomyces sp. JEL0837]